TMQLPMALAITGKITHRAVLPSTEVNNRPGLWGGQIKTASYHQAVEEDFHPAPRRQQRPYTLPGRVSLQRKNVVQAMRKSVARNAGELQGRCEYTLRRLR